MATLSSIESDTEKSITELEKVPAPKKGRRKKDEADLSAIGVEEGDQLNLIARARARFKDMENALACGRSRNRDKALLEIRLANTVDMMAIIESAVIKSNTGRGIQPLMMLNSDMREIMNDLRGIGTNEETVDYIDDVMGDIIKILMQQDLNLQKGVKDEITKHCEPAVANLIIDRMNMLTMSKAQLYDDIANMMREKVARYLDE